MILLDNQLLETFSQIGISAMVERRSTNNPEILPVALGSGDCLLSKVVSVRHVAFIVELVFNSLTGARMVFLVVVIKERLPTAVLNCEFDVDAFLEIKGWHVDFVQQMIITSRK
jgi:hypothetical protein